MTKNAELTHLFPGDEGAGRGPRAAEPRRARPPGGVEL